MVQFQVRQLLTELVESYPRRATDLRVELLKRDIPESIIAEVLRLKIGKPQPADTIPCLSNGARVRMSDMLAARFAFAGAIHDISGHFLSIKEMEALLKRKAFRELVTTQARDWEGCAPATVPFDRLSVFSLRSLEDGDVTYMVWPDAARASYEPEFWEYQGQSEVRHENLAAYLRHIGR